MSVPSTSGSASTPYDISTVDLDDDRYEVTQSAIRNKYVVRDRAGNVVLRGKQMLFKMKEEFPFVDGNDEDAFTVNASSSFPFTNGNSSFILNIFCFPRRTTLSALTRTTYLFRIADCVIS